MENENNATQVILARKTEVLELLGNGISWRRLAYLLQLPETSCRRAINSIPELAEAKRPEGYAAEIALAKSFAALKANGFQAAEVKAWIAARSSYDTNRAKGAYYRTETAKAIREEQEQTIQRTVAKLHPRPPFELPFQTKAERKLEAQREQTEQNLRQEMEITDYEPGL